MNDAADSERVFRALVESSNDWVWQINDLGVFTYCSPKIEAMLGYRPEEAAGRSRFDFMPADEALRMARLFATHALRRLPMSLVESENLHRDGRRVIIETNAVPYFDDTGIYVGYRGVDRDITARRLAEEQLRASEADYRNLFENMAQGVVYQNREGFITRANAAAERILGISVDAMRGLDSRTPVWQSVREDGSPFPGNEHPSMRALTSGREVRNTVMGIRNAASGEQRWINIHAIPIFRPGEGLPHEVFTTFEDITELKASERVIRESRERLRELSAHLARVREEEKAGIAREIHDELGGTLTAIGMDVFWISERLPGGDAALCERFADMQRLIEQAVQSTRRLITELRPMILDDLGLFAAIEWQVREFQKRSGIVCVVSIVGEQAVPPDVSITLFRVLQETLTNVARHSGARRVDVDVWIADDGIHLEVGDDGCGFAVAGTPPASSHGIRGMTERVAQLGGRLDVRSAPGAGVCIGVVLPLAGGTEPLPEYHI